MASQEAARYAQTLLISELATQYYELIGLDRQKEIIKVAIQNTEDSYKLTYELKQEGEVTQLGVDHCLRTNNRLKRKNGPFHL